MVHLAMLIRSLGKAGGVERRRVSNIVEEKMKHSKISTASTAEAGLLTNREFVRLIRSRLDAYGHTGIAIKRNWIDQDTPGYPLLLKVPVGTELVIPLQPLDSSSEKHDHDLDREVGHFVTALVNLSRAEKMLLKYAKDVTRAANAVIATARADGLDVLLDSVGFKPTYAYHLSGEDWMEASHHVLAAVNVKHTSFYLRPEVSEVWIEEPGDVAGELEPIFAEQRERQQRMIELDEIGADLIVDQITLDLLAAHDLDAADVLTQVWKKQCLNLTVKHLGRDTSLFLSTSDGFVRAMITLEDAIWNGEELWFCGDEYMKDRKDLVGKCVGELVRHPVFASRPIIEVSRHIGNRIFFDLSDKVLFDGDTGKLWREDRQAV